MDPQVIWVLVAIGLSVLAILAVQRYRSRRELVSRVRELTALAEAGRGILTSPLDIDRLGERIFQEASRIIDTRTFQLGLYEAGEYHILYWTREGERIPNRRLALADPGGDFLLWLRERRQPFLVTDFQAQADQLPAGSRDLDAPPLRCGIFVPLIAHEEVIGALSIQSPRPRSFGESHLRLLTILANSAAASLSNARLLDQALRRARYQELLGEVSHQIRAIQPLPDLYRQVVTQVKRAFGFEGVSVYELQGSGASPQAQTGATSEPLESAPPRRSGGTLVLQATSSTSPGSADPIPLGESPVGLAALRIQPVILRRGEPGSEHFPAQVDAVLAVPLPIENDVVGVLEIRSSKCDEFEPDFVEAAELLAGHLAIAVLETRTYEIERRRSKQLEAVAEASRVATSILDSDQLFAQVLSLTSTRLGQGRVRLFLRQGERVVLRSGPSQTSRPSYALEGPGLIAFVARTGQPVLVPDVQKDERYIPAPGWEDTLSEMAVPLVFGDHVLGVLDLQSTRTAAFAAKDLQMVEAFAAMLAVATRNAQLFSRERDAAWLSASLLRVAETAARPSDPDESLLAIVRLIPGLVQRSQALLWRPLRESEVLFPQASEGLNPAEAEAFRRARPGLSAFCPADLLGADEAAWPGEWTCPSPSETDGFFHHSPVQVLPLRYAGRLLGLLTIPAPAASGEALPQRESRERSFLLGLVHQLAMVLEAKRLNVELEAARRLEQEMEVAREIQVSFLPKELPQVEGWQMSASWRSAREVGGDFYDFFPLPPSAEKGGGSQPRWGVVIADVADKGVPAALFMALSRTLFRAAAISRVDPATTLARVNDLLFTDASAELFVTAFYAVWEPDSGRFTYANAGHNPPLVVPVGGHPRWLLEHGVALGVIEGSAYRTRSLHLRPGETLVLYTDGLLDAENPDHQPFGSSRLEWCVLESRNLSAEEISDSITRALAAHLLTEEPFDDMTWVVFRRRPLEPPVKGERPGAPGLEADREAPQAGPRISPLA